MYILFQGFQAEKRSKLAWVLGDSILVFVLIVWKKVIMLKQGFCYRIRAYKSLYIKTWGIRVLAKRTNKKVLNKN